MCFVTICSDHVKFTLSFVCLVCDLCGWCKLVRPCLYLVASFPGSPPTHDPRVGGESGKEPIQRYPLSIIE